jgi:hypothetical protein
MHSGIMSGQAIEQWLTEPTTAFTPPADTTTPPGNPITPQPTTPIQETTDSQPGAQQVVPATKEEIEKFVEEGVQEGKAEEDAAAPQFFKDYTDLYTRLQEKKIAYPLEEGYVPKTEEEFWNALSQSTDYNAQVAVDQKWQEYLQSLPEPIKKVQQFALQGVTTAQELSRYVGALSQNEVIASLDPNKPEDQERIVLLHLLNTGLNEQEAREDIKDQQEMKKLEASAKRYFPALKKTYDDQVLHIEKEKQDILQEEQLFIETNATNTSYFIEQEDIVPFKVTDTLKSNIWELAAGVVGFNDKNEGVFAWEQHLKNLMMGDENSFRQYIKIMTFIADTQNYEQSVSTNAASDTNKKNFRKIAVNPGPTVNHQPQEPAPVTQKIQTPTRPTSNARWSGR